MYNAIICTPTTLLSSALVWLKELLLLLLLNGCIIERRTHTVRPC